MARGRPKWKILRHRDYMQLAIAACQRRGMAFNAKREERLHSLFLETMIKFIDYEEANPDG